MNYVTLCFQSQKTLMMPGTLPDYALGQKMRRNGMSKSCSELFFSEFWVAGDLLLLLHIGGTGAKKWPKSQILLEYKPYLCELKKLEETQRDG